MVSTAAAEAPAAEAHLAFDWRLAARLAPILVAALVGHHDYAKGVVGAGSFVLTVVGFALLTLGGWLGGAVVFVHGMRVTASDES